MLAFRHATQTTDPQNPGLNVVCSLKILEAQCESQSQTMELALPGPTKPTNDHGPSLAHGIVIGSVGRLRASWGVFWRSWMVLLGFPRI